MSPRRPGIDARSAGVVGKNGAKTIARPGAAWVSASPAAWASVSQSCDALETGGRQGVREARAGRAEERGVDAGAGCHGGRVRRGAPAPRAHRASGRRRGRRSRPRSGRPSALSCSASPAAAFAGVAARASRITGEPPATPRCSRRSASPLQPASVRAIASGRAPASNALAPASRPASAPGADGSASTGPRSWRAPSRRSVRRPPSTPAPGSLAGPRTRHAQDARGRVRRELGCSGIIGVRRPSSRRGPGRRRCGAWPRGRRRGCRADRRDRARRS